MQVTLCLYDWICIFLDKFKGFCLFSFMCIFEKIWNSHAKHFGINWSTGSFFFIVGSQSYFLQMKAGLRGKVSFTLSRFKYLFKSLDCDVKIRQGQPSRGHSHQLRAVLIKLNPWCHSILKSGLNTEPIWNNYS